MRVLRFENLLTSGGLPRRHLEQEVRVDSLLFVIRWKTEVADPEIGGTIQLHSAAASRPDLASCLQNFKNSSETPW
jgi:hypothetical protein